ncbi:MAG TPA: proton-conducting transporter membrane subunit, partial [Chloroflexota bacterium]
AVVAAASMILGNLLALQQLSLKRLLAYSSISHMGYALVAILSAGPAALTGVVFYAVAYSVTLLGAFGVVSALSAAGAEWSEIEDYRALFWRKPAAALLLAGLMLSLAGIPLTIGFIGKFLVLTAGVGSTLWTLSILLVLTSAVGLYFYLRVVVVMFTHSQHHVEAAMPRIRVSDGIVLAVVAVLLLVLGIYPDPLVSLIQTISLLPR